MKGFIGNIEQLTRENTDYRRVLYTARNCQLVLMSIEPTDEIGSETHELDQFIRIEQGKATVTLDGIAHQVEDDFAIIIPSGTEHNVVNTGSGPLMVL